MRGRIRRHRVRLLRAGGQVDGRALLVRMRAHRNVVGMIVVMHVRHRQTELVLLGRVQRDAVRLLRHVLADDPQAGHVGVVVDGLGELAAPRARLEEGDDERQADRKRLQLVTTDEAALGIVARFVRDDARHGRAAPHAYRLIEGRVHRPGGVALVVAPDLAGRIREAVGELVRLRQEQQPRCLDGVAGDAHGARFLPLLFLVLVEVHDARHFALVVVLDPRRVTLGAQLEPAGFLRRRNLGVQGRPLGAGLAALEAEAELLAGAAPVAWLAVDRHAPGVAVLVAYLRRAVVEHLEVVVAGQPRDPIGARHAQLVLGARVVRLELLQRERPVEHVHPFHGAIHAADAELVLLKAQRRAGPVGGRASYGLADPRRKTGEVSRHLPGTRGRALVQPSELPERTPFVVDEAFGRFALAGLQQHHLDALLAQLVGERAAARPGADDDDH